MEYYLAIKNAICSNMDGPRDYHIKWSQTQKDKHHDITYMWILKKWYKWYKRTYLKNRGTDLANKLMGYQRGEVEETDKLGGWD